jgi:hypothetical protein
MKEIGFRNGVYLEETGFAQFLRFLGIDSQAMY